MFTRYVGNDHSIQILYKYVETLIPKETSAIIPGFFV